MKTMDPLTEPLNADACLGQIEALDSAVLTALLALGEGSLEKFEDSLWKQQVLCATLQHSLECFRCGTLDRPGVKRLVAAMDALHSLSRTYASAIDQANLSTALLRKLSESYQGLDARDTDGFAARGNGRSILCMA